MRLCNGSPQVNKRRALTQEQKGGVGRGMHGCGRWRPGGHAHHLPTCCGRWGPVWTHVNMPETSVEEVATWSEHCSHHQPAPCSPVLLGVVKVIGSPSRGGVSSPPPLRSNRSGGSGDLCGVSPPQALQQDPAEDKSTAARPHGGPPGVRPHDPSSSNPPTQRHQQDGCRKRARRDIRIHLLGQVGGKSAHPKTPWRFWTKVRNGKFQEEAGGVSMLDPAHGQASHSRGHSKFHEKSVKAFCL
ncbi:hypothetical protein SKAU_G00269920 [Synaphobranchus kaupii]|uniref:Uncharacterized protein n=1 Tax=Synaphobranchus kaupii TaxID=118154 RepID=A0A9Q1ING5_SYNKA|nr:hypothetical protein SKAU_G00269920 [Synaphobranchus kaupii]